MRYVSTIVTYNSTVQLTSYLLPYTTAVEYRKALGVGNSLINHASFRQIIIISASPSTIE